MKEMGSPASVSEKKKKRKKKHKKNKHEKNHPFKEESEEGEFYQQQEQIVDENNGRRPKQSQEEEKEHFNNENENEEKNKADAGQNNMNGVYSSVTASYRKELGLQISVHDITNSTATSSFSLSCSFTCGGSSMETMDIPPPLPLDCFQCSKTLALLDLPGLFRAFQQKHRRFLHHPTPIQAQVWPVLVQSSLNVSEVDKISSDTGSKKKNEKKRKNKKNTNVKSSIMRGLVGIAPTGSGKTLAYGLPLIHACSISTRAPIDQSPLGLVLAPTRELAQQIGKDLSKVARVSATLSSSSRTNENKDENTDKNMSVSQVKVITIHGGGGEATREEQLQTLSTLKNQNTDFQKKKNKRGKQLQVGVVVATPGRLLDLLRTATTTNNNSTITNNNNITPSLQGVRYLVLDEVDRMLQMGFREQIAALLAFCHADNKAPPLREEGRFPASSWWTAMFSATLSQELQEYAQGWFLRPPCTPSSDPGGGSIKVLTVHVSTMEIGSSLGGDGGNIIKSQEKQGSKMQDETTQESIDKSSQEEEEQQEEQDSKHHPHEETPKTNIMHPPNKNDKHDNQDEKPEKNKKRKLYPSGVATCSAIPSHVTQILHVCAAHKKPKKLLHVLQTVRKQQGSQQQQEGNVQRRQPSLVLIFFAKIQTLKSTFRLLQKQGMKQCAALHGGMRQADRDKVWREFCAGKTVTLLATDVAARGLHVKRLDVVINYDFPTRIEQYVHRCGRAGRSTISTLNHTDNSSIQNDTSLSTLEPNKAKAKVYSFFTRDLAPMAKDLIALLRASGADVDPNLLALVPVEGGEGGDNNGESVAKSTKKRRRNKKRKPQPGTNEMQPSAHVAIKQRDGDDSSEEGKGAVEEYGEDFDEGMDFAWLRGNGVVLKRASHVSDAEDSSDDSDG